MFKIYNYYIFQIYPKIMTKLYRCRAYLYCVYELCEMTPNEISKEYKVGVWVIYRLLRKFNLKRKKYLNKNKEWLYHQYIKLRKSTTKIGKECRVCSGTIHYWLKKFNIKRENPLYKDKKWLKNQYIKLKKSTREIGKKLGINNNIIIYWLEKFNIPKRSRNKVMKIAMNKPETNKKRSKTLKTTYNNPKIRAKISGKNNGGWKEWKELGYNRKHIRIKKMLAKIDIFKPDICPFCGKLKSKRKLDLMNINHTYKENTLDWYYICQHCHLGIYHFLVGFEGEYKTIKPIPNLINNLLQLKTREEREQLLKEVILKKK